MAGALIARFEKRYASGVAIAADLEVPLERHRVTVLFGPSGSGKTTVLRAIAGLERPERGVVRFGAETWHDAEAGISLSPTARGIGLVFQDYALFPHLDVAANVGYGLRHLSRAEREQRVADVLARYHVAGLARRHVRQLSGGEQQRVALARAVVREPRLMLLDEPLAALDSALREELREDLAAQLAAVGCPVILVTHDREEARILADLLVVMDAGRMLQAGPPDELFANPVNERVAACLGLRRR